MGQAFESLPHLLLANLGAPPVRLMIARGDLTVELGFQDAEGVWYPKTDIIDNTQLFHVMAKAAGVKTHSDLKIKKD